MNCKCELSNVTKDYLERFHYILDEMIEGMTEVDLTNSISHNFIVQMIPHHQAAIEMSRNILKYTTFMPVQDIATQIIAEQTKSIENMLDVESACSELVNSQQDVSLYQNCVNQIIQTMFNEMSGAYTDNQINANFMREMIPHHKSAIRMSRNVLRYDISPELNPILCAIIESQEKGVLQMERLLCCSGC